MVCMLFGLGQVLQKWRVRRQIGKCGQGVRTATPRWSPKTAPGQLQLQGVAGDFHCHLPFECESTSGKKQGKRGKYEDDDKSELQGPKTDELKGRSIREAQ